VGVLTLVVLLALLPFVYLFQWFRWVKQLPPHEQALARASHGAGIIAFVLLVGFGLFGVGGVGAFFVAVAGHPDDLWKPALLLAVVMGWGITWFIVGVKRASGLRDGLLTTRAIVKLAGGLGGLIYLSRIPAKPDTSVWVYLGVAFGFLAVLWCLVTGAVKVLLLTVSGGDALSRVARQIRNRTVVWVAARRNGGGGGTTWEKIKRAWGWFEVGAETMLAIAAVAVGIAFLVSGDSWWAWLAGIGALAYGLAGPVLYLGVRLGWWKFRR
jgi:hypothetical protein